MNKFLNIFALIFCLCMINCNRKHPILSSIGLTPISDKTSKKGFSKHRELIYKNTGNDPDFYKKIVSKIELSDAMKRDKYQKKSGRDMGAETLKCCGYNDSEIIESVTFKLENSKFACTISNGKRFVLVVLYTFY